MQQTGKLGSACFSGKYRRSLVAIGIACILLLSSVIGCHQSPALGEGKPVLTLTSSSIQNGEIIKAYTCDAADISPELAWSAPPGGTQSFALIVTDPDAPFGSFVHWVLYDLPTDQRELPEGFSTQAQLPAGTRQGRNDFDKTGYGGPCPPGKSAHRYMFDLYALDAKLNLPAGATRRQVEKALKGHILARGELIGRYQH